MSTFRTESGFSTVELLISLFIAAAFIGTGFQLFSVVTDDSNKARLRAAAGTKATEEIQKNMANATNNGPTCNNPAANITTPVPTAELPNATVVVSFSCPYGTESKTTRVKAVVTYGTPPEQVERSLDVTR